MATLDDGAKAEAANNLRSGMEAPDSAKTVDADENEIRKSREKAELGEGKDQDQGNGAESRTNARGDGRVGDEAKRKHLNDETASGSSKKSAEHDDASDDSIRSKKTTETTARGADDCLTADQLQIFGSKSRVSRQVMRSLKSYPPFWDWVKLYVQRIFISIKRLSD